MYEEIDRDEVSNIRFRYHECGEEQVQLMQAIRDAIRELATDMLIDGPDCREVNLAIEKLEEAMMWFNAGVARRGGEE